MLNVGHIRYLNSLPIYYGIESQSTGDAFNLQNGSPTQLNDRLLRGELDVSPISSIEYCRNAEKLLLLPDICVSSDGDVKSILLAYNGEIEWIKSVALTSSSATSQVLTRILLSKSLGLNPAYQVMEPDVRKMLSQCDAGLLIGDDALDLYLSRSAPFIDLGKEWQKMTGMPMVYAVWVVRRDAAEREPKEVARLAEHFAKSIDYCYSHRQEVADRAAAESGLSSDFLYQYFGDLKFTLSTRYRNGMKRFFQEAAIAGEVESVPELEFFG